MQIMYYEKKKNNSFGIILILLFLAVIIMILISLIEKVDRSIVSFEATQQTGTDTVLAEFSIENLAKNASYSIVRSFKIK